MSIYGHIDVCIANLTNHHDTTMLCYALPPSPNPSSYILCSHCTVPTANNNKRLFVDFHNISLDLAMRKTLLFCLMPAYGECRNKKIYIRILKEAEMYCNICMHKYTSVARNECTYHRMKKNETTKNSIAAKRNGFWAQPTGKKQKEEKEEAVNVHFFFVSAYKFIVPSRVLFNISTSYNLQ